MKPNIFETFILCEAYRYQNYGNGGLFVPLAEHNKIEWLISNQYMIYDDNTKTVYITLKGIEYILDRES